MASFTAFLLPHFLLDLPHPPFSSRFTVTILTPLTSSATPYCALPLLTPGLHSLLVPYFVGFFLFYDRSLPLHLLHLYMFARIQVLQILLHVQMILLIILPLGFYSAAPCTTPYVLYEQVHPVPTPLLVH